MKTQFLENSSLQSRIRTLLLKELTIPAHRIGFKALMMAILICTEQDIHYYSSELYPNIAKSLDISDGEAVAQAIHEVIQDGYEEGNKIIWAKYFPTADKAPSNKVFISTLAEYLKK